MKAVWMENSGRCQAYLSLGLGGNRDHLCVGGGGGYLPLYEFPGPSCPAYPAVIDQRTLQEETALYLATCRGHLDCLQSLLQAGAEPDISNKSRETPLYKGEPARVGFPRKGPEASWAIRRIACKVYNTPPRPGGNLM